MPKTQIAHGSFYVSSTGWFDIELLDLSNLNLNEAIHIDANQDLWVFIYDPEKRLFPASYGNSDGNDYGSYYSVGVPQEYLLNSDNGIAWLINTYVTDGTYTYNLYDGTTTVASNISNTTYTVNNIANNTAHRYTLKTNYNGGETDASNMVGFSLGNATLTSLSMAANDKMTITEGSKLTVSGTLSDVNVNNLILENGAQLVNGSTGVKATVKKNISAYSQNGGWYLMASPLTENLTASNIAGLLSNNYDLYTFDQSEELEWRNIEAGAFATINNKTGYLYANSGNPTLSFEGTLAASTSATPLVYDANAYFKGFNLIGNPYPCNVYVNKSFYVMNNDGSDFTLGSNPIPPCAAILVQAQGTGESVTFSKTASKNAPNIAISVAEANMKGNAVVDQAKVVFDEKDQLRKYTLNEQGGKLYIPQNGQDFAVANAIGENEMPINFKAGKNGVYTLSVELESLDLDYLHLIDNMTGSDIDLLATPSYTFEAKTTEYASRFRLVFSNNENAVDDNATFALVYNNEIVVNHASKAILQVVDMMGRVIIEKGAIHHISTSGMAPGVYVLRLIDAESVKTQKIVIE